MPEPFREIGKFLVVAGILLAGIGVLLMAGSRLPLKLGRLPGDISYSGKSCTFYFPIVTCILLSIALTLLMWVVNLFRR